MFLVKILKKIKCFSGFKYWQPFVRKDGIHDTCGILNLHAIPGVLGGIASAVAASYSHEKSYGPRLSDILYMRIKGRTPIQQGGYQILCLIMSVGIAIIGGIFTGIILKMFTKNASQYFKDGIYWEVVEDEKQFDTNNSHLKPNEAVELESMGAEVGSERKK